MDISNTQRRLFALIKKECYQIIRDPSSILISFVLPVILLFLYGFGVSLDANTVRIGIVMEDTAPDAQSLCASFTGSRYFDVQISHTRKTFEKQIIAGHIRGIIVIPAYFSEFRKGSTHVAPIQVITDGSEPNTANFVQNYAKQVLQNWLRHENLQKEVKWEPIIKMENRFWYNEQLESRNFLVPGSLAIIMTLIGTLLTALVVAREWERGTMEAMMATPVTILELLLGKLIPYFILGMLSMALCVLTAVFFYHVPLRGSYLLLSFVSGCFLFTALGLGLLISTLSRNQFVASQISMVTAFLPAYILSGFIFEITSMPLPIQLITYIIPARYFVSCLQTLFLVGDVWELILLDIIPIVLVGLIFFGITARNTVKRLDL